MCALELISQLSVKYYRLTIYRLNIGTEVKYSALAF